MVAKQKTFFKDLPLSFNINPVTNDVSFAKNEEAVKKALLNILRTPLNTRPFRPDFGVNISRYLFEPSTYNAEININKEVAEAIRKFEPRVQLISIESKVQENSAVVVEIRYLIAGFQQQQIIQTSISTRVK
jgi:phage baseplate assembly protein W